MNPGDTFWRAVVSILIWLAATGIVITGFIMTPESAIWILIVTMIAAGTTTATMWESSKSGAGASAASEASADKAKRESTQTDKLALLMELMDEDERATFKKGLMDQVLRERGLSRDGELPIDAEYFEDDTNAARHG